jgi:hypothetical protein
MMANALAAATVVSVAVAFYLMQRCSFLVPYRGVLLHEYGRTLACWGAVLFVNVAALCYAAGRALFLKETGRKLAHLEKQLKSGTPPAEELARRLES